MSQTFIGNKNSPVILYKFYYRYFQAFAHYAAVFTLLTSCNLLVLTLLLLLCPSYALCSNLRARPREHEHAHWGLGPTQWKGGAPDLKQRVVLCWCVAHFKKWARQAAGVWARGERAPEAKQVSAERGRERAVAVTLRRISPLLLSSKYKFGCSTQRAEQRVAMELSSIGDQVFAVESITKKRVRKVRLLFCITVTTSFPPLSFASAERWARAS